MTKPGRKMQLILPQQAPGPSKHKMPHLRAPGGDLQLGWLQGSFLQSLRPSVRALAALVPQERYTCAKSSTLALDGAGSFGGD